MCNYCDFYKHKLTQTDQISRFESRVLSEIQLNEIFLKEKQYTLNKLETVYIGGGTPSLWSLSGANFLLENIIKRYGLKKECEFTIEVDPGTWTSQEIDSWVEIGVNRFSIGIQTYDSKFLPIMDRVHTMQEANELLLYLRDKKYNYSIDLMLGLPKSESITRDIKSEIHQLIEFNPSHFSVYILKTRKNYPLNSDLPSEEYVSDEYLRTCEILSSAGYEQYEVSNFALPGCKSNHNLKYWNYKSVACLGANATGLLVDKDLSTRYQWKSIGEGMTTEIIQGTSLEIEKIYMKLRTSKGLAANYFRGENNKLFKEVLDAWSNKGYLEEEDSSGIQLTAKGYLFIDSLMDDIFSKLNI